MTPRRAPAGGAPGDVAVRSEGGEPDAEPGHEIAGVDHGRIVYRSGLMAPLTGNVHYTVPAGSFVGEPVFDHEPRRTRRRRASGKVPRSDPPRMALRLFAPHDAAHYAREWGAHLWELIADGDHRQARRDRRRMAMSAPRLALRLRVRALLRRGMRSSR